MLPMTTQTPPHATDRKKCIEKKKEKIFWLGS
jgi:hypothetical protein